MADGIDFPGYVAAGAVEATPVHRFDAARGAWRESAGGGSTARVERITCVTFNTWFQGPDAALRNAGLIACLERIRPDVAMLQEVTVPLLEALCATPWLREAYGFARSAFRVDTIPAHGVVLFSRLPIVEASVHRLKTFMGRRLLAARCRVNGGELALATAHLESMKNYGDVRGEQLRAIFGVLEGSRDAVLGGDFNFCASWAAENSRLDPRYADLWARLRPGEPGYTQDTALNAMLAIAKQETKQVRFDRLLLRSDPPRPRWAPQAIELLGTAPVDAAHPKVFPSDHFGLAATLRWTG